ncbi:MAG: hypothetical protein NC911_04300 [Candidatus Omnitrophica bacterium]|nr:hypothetical protein [Candidatus Omnitrophota bacterium]
MDGRRFGEWLLVIVSLQVLLSAVLKWKLAGPICFFLWILFLGWGKLEVASIFMGFLLGLFYDLLVRGVIGWNGLLLSIIAYLNCYFPQGSLREKVLATVVFGIFYSAGLIVNPEYGLVWEGGQMLRFSLIFSGIGALGVTVIFQVERMGLWTRKSYW